MIGREFCKRLRLLNGRHETIKTTFEMNEAGRLVEHVVLQTHDLPMPSTSEDRADQPRF